MFDSRYQDYPNGHLSPTLRARILKAKAENRLRFEDLGLRFGLSGAMVAAVVREQNPARVRSRRVPTIVAALERIERGELSIAKPVPAQPAPAAVSASRSLAELVKAVNAMGLAVTFAPTASARASLGTGLGHVV